METFSGYKLESLIDPIVDEGRGGSAKGFVKCLSLCITLKIETSKLLIYFFVNLK